MTNVAVFSESLPRYRQALLTELSKNPLIRFTFCCSTKRREDGIVLAELSGINHRETRFRKLQLPLMSRPVLWCSHSFMSLLLRKYDVIILRDNLNSADVWFCAILGRLRGVSVCVWGQGISRPATKPRVAVRRFLYRLVNCILLYTDGGKKFWERKGIPQDKLFVAYNALDTALVRRLTHELESEDLETWRSERGMNDRQVVLWVARLLKNKRPDLFVEAIREARNHRDDILGVIIGEGPERLKLEQSIRAHDLQRHVTFVGAIFSEHELARYFNSAKAVIVPAGGGLTIQHAMGYGVPVILGDVLESHCPEHELVRHGETGLRVRPCTGRALADAICTLVERRELHGRLAAGARQLIRDVYNEHRMAQGFTDAIQYCMSTRAG